MHSVLKIFFGYKNKRSKYEVEKVVTMATPFLIFVFCPSEIKNYIITMLVSNFLMHLVRGWHLLCRKKTPLVFLPEICWQEVAEEIFFHISFSWRCLTLGLNRGLTFNKLTHYLLEHDNFTCLYLRLPNYGQRGHDFVV